MDTFGPVNSFQSGSIYVVNCDAEEEGFLLAKCQFEDETSVNASYLEKCAGGNSEEQFFKESGENGQIPLESVHSSPITLIVVSSANNVYSVNRLELEDILFSLET